MQGVSLIHTGLRSKTISGCLNSVVFYLYIAVHILYTLIVLMFNL